MSQQFPPPSPQTDGNPFAQEAHQPARVRRTALGILAGVLATVVGALLYGGLMRLLADEDGSYTEIGYAAVGVGALVGAAAGRIGGRDLVLPFIAVPLGLAGVVAGQLFGYALMISWWSEAAGQALSVTTIIFGNSSDLFTAWKEEFDVMGAVFLALAGFAAFGTAKRLGD